MAASAATVGSPGSPKWSIALHGGAGVILKSINPQRRAHYIDGLRDALQTGVDALKRGESALRVVELVTIKLEEHPVFNAGKGAVRNFNGKHELDASIMDGKTLNCGAVAGLRTVRNPVSLARLVMEHTEHVMLIADGAEQFATEMKVERVPNEWFDTARRKQQWEEAHGIVVTGELVQPTPQVAKANPTRHSTNAPAEDDHKKHGTVGVACLDIHGHLAAATSTGGLMNKKYGRVGDSPIIGAGTYANDKTCAVSCTGHGEKFIRQCVAHSISAMMEFVPGTTLNQAAEHIVHKKLEPGDGGIIAVSHTGEIALVFNSEGMFRAAADSAGRYEVAIWEERNILLEAPAAETTK